MSAIRGVEAQHDSLKHSCNQNLPFSEARHKDLSIVSKIPSKGKVSERNLTTFTIMKNPCRLSTGDYAPSKLYTSPADLQDVNTSILFAKPGLPVITITYPLSPQEPTTRVQRKWERLQDKNHLCVPERNLKRRARRKPRAPPDKLGARSQQWKTCRKRLAGCIAECESVAFCDKEREDAELSMMELKKALEHENRQTGFRGDREWMVGSNDMHPSQFAPKQQATTPSRDTPQVSHELPQAMSRLNATLDGSMAKMQKIIDETKAQLPEQPRLPDVPQIANKKDASPPWDCGCEDELYTRDGCQCYQVTTSAIADLEAGLKRGLKRKELEEGGEMMEVDSVCDEMVREDASPLADSRTASYMLRRHPDDKATSMAANAEPLMLQRQPDDVSQGNRKIMALPVRSEQQLAKAGGQAEEQSQW
ncbi:uncharacterized protein CLAFUR5_04857 [Fulvia fulva]|uniref:Uncharacterized protein n=1 Tax=Passalora fulva TaxID=5499 RepID=A0A9Q8P7U1_PASFU|nr:uncharacterized protein CLAFUR5_04857 [Fulvia fulva]UJO16232.1 hypothetical protein CLAFUR5_04857 [Fulvia fulva]